MRYAADQAEFFRDFSAAFRKLSELGAKFQFVVQVAHPEPIEASSGSKAATVQ